MSLFSCILGFLIVIFLTACSSPTSHDAPHPLQVENRLLALEMPVAKKAKLYSIIHIPGRVIQVKIRGELLREYRILDVKVHHPWDAHVFKASLAQLGIANPPERVVVMPQPKERKEEGDSEAIVVEKLDDSFELDDMPPFYSIEMADGSQILVLPKTKDKLKFSERLSNSFVRLAFFGKRLASFRNPSATLILSPDDSRALYWVLMSKPSLIVSA